MDSYLVRIWRPAGDASDDDLRGVVVDLATQTTTTFPDRSTLLRLLQAPHVVPPAEPTEPTAEVGP